MKKLNKLNKIKRQGPVVLIIMDGMGIDSADWGDAFFHARTPVYDNLLETCMHTQLKAHGTAVGLPSDKDMGNSEVGHNALGAGKVFSQGAQLVNEAVEKGAIFNTDLWKDIVLRSQKKTLHFIGLLSDGNVHSHVKHLFRMVEQCADEKIQCVKIHILLDGRDVPETSALEYIEKLETFLAQFREQGHDYAIASGGGRMITTMDRYEADWDIVKRGWQAHVLGAARPFSSARKAIETFRNEKPGITDQYLPAFTIVDERGPVGPIQDGDSVVYFNFRGDRAIEISRAFDEKDFNCFDRERYPDVLYAGMMQYDGDLQIPRNYLVAPPVIQETISEYLAYSGIKQYAVSETQKFGHVTYFWNGNRSGKFDDKSETYEEIPSDKIEFDLKPWMKAGEITDAMIRALESKKYGFLRLNYPNGDMVGHTGNFEAAIIAAETVDLSMGRVLKSIEEHQGIAVITADHGNLDEMFEKDAKSGEIKIDPKTGLPRKKTSHTLNPVPLVIYDPGFNHEYKLASMKEKPGLGNVASTLLQLMDLETPEEYLPSVIEWT